MDKDKVKQLEGDFKHLREKQEGYMSTINSYVNNDTAVKGKLSELKEAQETTNTNKSTVKTQTLAMQQNTANAAMGAAMSKVAGLWTHRMRHIRAAASDRV